MPNVILTQPTAYVCRGCRVPVFHELPDLPYTIVFKESVTKYTIAYSGTPIAIETNDSGEYLLAMGNPHCFYRYDTRANTDWVQGSVYEYATRYTMSSYQNPIWSTHKVVYPNGTLFIDKSDPPAALYEGNTEAEDSQIDLYSWTVGLALGLTDGLNMIDNSAFEDIKSETPVAYLYNGVRLPKLPDFNEPYAAIVKEGGAGFIQYRLIVMGEKPVLTVNEGSVYGRIKCSSVSYHWYFNADEDTDWDGRYFHEYATLEINIEKVWANYDMLLDNGTIYLAASEPVPVYE